MSAEPAISSGAIAVTTGAQQVTGQGVLTYASLLGGTTANTFAIYDGTSTSGTLLAEVINTAVVSQDANIPAHGVQFQFGLYVVVSGSGSKGVLHYRRT